MAPAVLVALLVASAAAVRGPLLPSDVGPNLVVNGGAENGDTNSWARSSGSGTLGVSTTRFGSGSRSFFVAGARTYFSQFVDTPGGAGRTFLGGASLRYYSGGPSTVEFIAQPSGSQLFYRQESPSSFVRYQGTFQLPTGTTQVEVKISMQDGYVDDIFLVDATEWTICEILSSAAVLTAASGNIALNAGYDYPDYLTCSMSIQPSGLDGIVVLEFDRFATESRYDFLRIYDSSDYTSDLFALDGTSLPSAITEAGSRVFSSGNSISLRFTSDQSVHNFPGFALSYRAIPRPRVTTLDPASGISGFGIIVTVSGSDFGSQESDVVVTIGGSTCPLVPGSLTGSSLQCTLPSGTLGARDVVVSVLGVASQAPFAQFTYVESPVADSIFPRAAVAGDSTVLTISGSHFGTSATLSITVAGQPCAAVALLSSSAVTCTTPTDLTPAIVDVIPSLNGITASAVSLTVLAARPILSAIDPAGGVIGSVITLTGDHFGSAEGDIDILVGGQPCPRVAASLDDCGPSCASIRCTVPSGSGISPVSIARLDAPSAESISFTYITAPIVLTASPLGLLADSAGAVLTVDGSGFGAEPTDLEVLVAGEPCPVQSIAPGGASLTCSVPSVPEGPATVTVRRYNVMATGSVQLSFIAAPNPASVTPAGGRIVGQSVISIAGSGFGTDNANVAVTVAGQPCPIGGLTSVLITCTIPSVTEAQPAPIVVTRFDIPGLSTLTYNYVTPTATGVTPPGGAQGTELTVLGDFGTIIDPSFVSINIAGIPCELTDNVTPTAVSCTVPNVALGSLPVTLAHHGVFVPEELSFFGTIAPVVDTVSPVGGGAGQTVVVTGGSMGYDESVLEIEVGDIPCVIIPDSLRDTVVRCTMAESNSPGVYDVVVTKFGGAVDQEPHKQFKYVTAPVVNEIDPTVGQANTRVRVTGVLGVPLSCLESEFLITIDSFSCSVIQGSLNDDCTELECAAPAGPTIGVSNEVVVSRLQTTAVNRPTIEYIPFPAINSIDPERGQVGATLTISADNLGSVEGDISITLGGQDCPVGSLNADSVECTLPDAVGSVEVVLSVRGVEALGTTIFTYEVAPVITDVVPAGGVGDDIVTLIGENFQGTSPAVTVGGLPCTSLFINGQGTEATCRVPDQTVPDDYPVIFSHGSLDSAPGPVFKYSAAPSISDVIPDSGQAGNIITVQGVFGTAASNIAEADITVFVGTSECVIEPGTLVSNTDIQCVVPPGFIGAAPVVLSLFGGALSSAPASFEYEERPVVFSISPPGGREGSITVLGGGFGESELDLQVTVGSGVCDVVTGSLNAAGNTFRCDLPDTLTEGPHDVVVSVDTATSLAPHKQYIYIPQPVISAVTPRGGSRGEAIEITGTDLGALGETTVTVGGLACSVVSAGANTVVCTTPSGLPGPQPVVVSRFEVLSELDDVDNPVLFSYVSSPVVRTVTPSGGKEGDVIIISGQLFGEDESALRVTIGGQDCEIVEGSFGNLFTEVSCTVPALDPPEATSGSREVVVYRFASASANAVVFDYVPAPVVADVAPPQGQPDQELVITGSDFGTDESALTITIDGEVARIQSGSLDALGTQVRCIVPDSAEFGPQDLVVRRFTVAQADSVSFTYIPSPSVLSVEPKGGLAGSTIDITGSNFGNSVSAVSVTIGGTPCVIEPGTFTPTSLTCEVGVGILGSQPVEIMVYDTPSPASATASFLFINQPFLQGVAPAGGRSGTVLTISGGSFGSSEADLSVEIGGSPCPIASGSLNSIGTQVRCEMPDLGVGQFPVVLRRLEVETLTSSVVVQSVAVPTVDSLYPLGGVAGESITLRGSDFGNPGDTSVQVGLNPCDIDSAVSNTTFVVCRVPNGFLGLQTVVLRNFGVASTAPNPRFEYIQVPIVLDVNPPLGLAGNEIVILGRQFGPNLDELTVTIGDYPCEFPGDLSSTQGGTQLRCIVDAGLPKAEHRVVVWRFLVESTGAKFFTHVDAPEVDALSPMGGLPDQVVTVSGSNFGADESLIAVEADTSPDPTSVAVVPGSLNTDGTSFRVRMPILGTGLVDINVSVIGIAASTARQFEYVSVPLVSDVSPDGGLPGTEVLVSGDFFGDDEALLSIEIHDVEQTVPAPAACTIVPGSLARNDGVDEVRCTLSVSSFGARGLRVRRFEVLSDSSVAFTFVNLPTVGSVSPTGGEAGNTLVIKGTDWGNIESDLAVAVGGFDCPIVAGTLNNEGTSVSCVLPVQPEPGLFPVVVTRFETASESSFSFLYVPPPTITTVSPEGGQEGQIVTLTGRDFGDDPAFVRASIGGVDCSIVPGSLTTIPEPGFNATRLLCEAPPVALGPRPVVVSNHGVVATNLPDFIYAELPIVLRVSPPGGVVGDIVTLSGNHFGSDANSVDDLVVELGGIACNIVEFRNSSTSLSEIVVEIPVQVTGPHHFVVTLLDIFVSIENSADIFSIVNVPAVEAVFPEGGKEGGTLTVSGTSFGTDPTQLEVFVGMTECSILELFGSGESLVCFLAANLEFGVHDVYVTRFGNLDSPLSGVQFELIPLPNVTGVTPPGGDILSEMTVIGFGFGNDDTVLQVKLGGADGVDCSVIPGSLSDPDPLSGLQSVDCVVPGTRFDSADQAVTVCLFGDACSLATDIFFSIASTPVVTGLEPGGGQAGEIVVVKGAEFGRFEDQLRILMDGEPCPIVPSSLNSRGTQVSCVVPEFDGTLDRPVQVLLYSLESNDDVLFEFVRTPTVLSIEPRGGLPGDQVTIRGRDFSDDVTATVGGELCRMVQPVSVDDDGLDVIVCEVAGDFVGERDVVVSNFDVASEINGVEFLYVDAPRIKDLSPDGGYGGDLVRITARNLGPSEADISVRIGEYPCELVAGTLREINGDDSVIDCRISSEITGRDFGAQSAVVTVFGRESEPPHPNYYYLIEDSLYAPELTSPEGIAFVALAAATALAVVGLIVFVTVYRTSSVIKAASPLFCGLILVGALVVLGGIVVLAGRPSSTRCMTREWLRSTGLILLLGNLFAKTFRLYKIFGNKKLRRVVITNGDLVKMVFKLMLFDITILTLWTVMSPNKAEVLFADPPALICASENVNEFEMATLGYKILLLGFGAFLAWNTWELPTRYNESRHISVAIYNTLLILILVTVLENSVNAQQTVFIVRALGDLLVVWSVIGSVFVPKVMMVVRHGGGEAAEGGSASASATTGTYLGGSAAHGDAVLQTSRSMESVGSAVELQLWRE